MGWCCENAQGLELCEFALCGLRILAGSTFGHFFFRFRTGSLPGKPWGFLKTARTRHQKWVKLIQTCCDFRTCFYSTDICCYQKTISKGDGKLFLPHLVRTGFAEAAEHCLCADRGLVSLSYFGLYDLQTQAKGGPDSSRADVFLDKSCQCLMSTIYYIDCQSWL